MRRSDLARISPTARSAKDPAPLPRLSAALLPPELKGQRGWEEGVPWRVDIVDRAGVGG